MGQRWWCLAEAAFLGVEGHRAHAESAAELGDAQTVLFLTLDLVTPPFAPRSAIYRRSESYHHRSPGDETLGFGIDVTIRVKDGSAERLQNQSTSGTGPALDGAVPMIGRRPIPNARIIMAETTIEAARYHNPTR